MEKRDKLSSHCGQLEPITTGQLGALLYQNTPPGLAPSPILFKSHVYAVGPSTERWGGGETSGVAQFLLKHQTLSSLLRQKLGHLAVVLS